MVMIFNHPLVRAYLLEHGLVYTFRKRHQKTADGIRPQTGKDWATNKRCGKKIANINITPITPMRTRRSLYPYIKCSGFYHGDVDEGLEAWVDAIKDLNSDKIPEGWIYKVEIRNEEPQ